MQGSGHRVSLSALQQPLDVDDSTMAGTDSAVVPTNRHAILLAIFIAFGALFFSECGFVLLN